MHPDVLLPTYTVEGLKFLLSEVEQNILCCLSTHWQVESAGICLRRHYTDPVAYPYYALAYIQVSGRQVLQTH
jgi:hypothetical protein